MRNNANNGKRSRSRKRRRSGRRVKPLANVRREVARLAALGDTRTPEEDRRFNYYSSLIRAAEKSVLCQHLEGGEETYNRLAEKYGHAKLFEAFSEGLAELTE